jgi:hypothetical protein
MNIYIPRSLIIAAGVLCCAAFVALVVKQAPELTRYVKLEGM